MSFEVTEDILLQIQEHPHKLGHVVGKTKLTELHSEWIRYIWKTKEDRSLQAHRGSYKSTAVTVVGVIWWLLFNPNERIAIIRKSFTDASDTLRTIMNMFMLPELQQIFYYAHNKLIPKMLVKKDNKIVFNFKKSVTPEGSIDAYGVETGITGRHYDKIICDDIVTVKDKLSAADRDRTKEMVREIRTNIIDPGKQVSFVGTPWHPDDAWEVCPKPIKKFSIDDCQLLSKEDIEAKKQITTPSLFACNYLLKHVSDEECLFRDIKYDTWNFDFCPIGHIDASYGGRDYTVFTMMNYVPHKDKIYAIGWARQKNIRDLWDFIRARWMKYRCGRVHAETNSDKGFVVDNLRGFGIPSRGYHEKLNKHLKITTYLLKYWDKVYWSKDTDDAYLNMIVDYNENAVFDDSPDSASSLLMKIFKKQIKRSLWEF